jgi:hypothetical protein
MKYAQKSAYFFSARKLSSAYTEIAQDFGTM